MSPLVVACPTCPAGIGQQCWGPDGRPLATAHFARLRARRELTRDLAAFAEAVRA